jgi:hypothetical protein
MDVDQTDGGSAAAVQAEPCMREVTIKWKTRSWYIQIDLGKPAQDIKMQIWQLTDVMPENQYLLGVYKRGQDVDLRTLGIQNDQSLVLIGEATLGSYEKHAGIVRPVYTEPPAIIPSDAKRGFFSYARLTKDEVQAAIIIRDGEAVPRPIRGEDMLSCLGLVLVVVYDAT